VSCNAESSTTVMANNLKALKLQQNQQ